MILIGILTIIQLTYEWRVESLIQFIHLSNYCNIGKSRVTRNIKLQIIMILLLCDKVIVCEAALYIHQARAASKRIVCILFWHSKTNWWMFMSLSRLEMWHMGDTCDNITASWLPYARDKRYRWMTAVRLQIIWLCDGGCFDIEMLALWLNVWFYAVSPSERRKSHSADE